MNQDKRETSNWHFPPDLAVLLMPGLFAIPCIFLISLPFRVGNGDPTLLVVALALAVIGIVLLFFARLPLYRQRRFLTFGPGALSGVHRTLYYWAYVFIGASAFVLGMLWLLLR